MQTSQYSNVVSLNKFREKKEEVVERKISIAIPLELVGLVSEAITDSIESLEPEDNGKNYNIRLYNEVKNFKFFSEQMELEKDYDFYLELDIGELIFFFTGIKKYVGVLFSMGETGKAKVLKKYLSELVYLEKQNKELHCPQAH